MAGPIRPSGILQPARARPEAQPITPAPAQGEMAPEQMQQLLMMLMMLMGAGGGAGGMALDAASAPMGQPSPLPMGGLPNG